MARPKPPATYADLEALPENLVGEILDGELFTSPRPRPRHSVATGGAHAALLGPFQHGRGGPGGWHILIEPEVKLGRDVVVPDIAGWRRERVPAIPDVVPLELVPDWACEVLSPSTTKIDRGRKMRIYARAGIDHLWLVDPVVRLLEIHRRQDRTWVLIATYGDDDVVRAEPFDAIELALTDWWVWGGAAAEPYPAWDPRSPEYVPRAPL